MKWRCFTLSNFHHYWGYIIFIARDHCHLRFWHLDKPPALSDSKLSTKEVWLWGIEWEVSQLPSVWTSRREMLGIWFETVLLKPSITPKFAHMVTAMLSTQLQRLYYDVMVKIYGNLGKSLDENLATLSCQELVYCNNVSIWWCMSLPLRQYFVILTSVSLIMNYVYKVYCRTDVRFTWNMTVYVCIFGTV